MNKKIIILVAIIIVAVIGILLYMHNIPIWVSISNLIFILSGVVIGWIAQVLYNKYIKKQVH